MKYSLPAFLLSALLFLMTAEAYDPSVMASLSPYCDIDSFDAAPKVAEIRLVNERVSTHKWEFSLSDEEVLTCVGTQVGNNSTEFSFSGKQPGVCDVIFEYKRIYAPRDPVLITEVYRFYVDPDLGVTCEHIHFSTNET